MKVSVITRHAITNYGSLLQAFATQKAVETLGYDCEIIDYIRRDESYREHEKTILKTKTCWNKNFILRFVYLAIRQPWSILAGKRFEQQRKRFLHLSDRYESSKSLYENYPQADVFMTGSDQVWGPTEDGSYDDSYCLSFAKGKKKIAYAGSFGRTEMSQERKDYFKRLLSDYSYVTVREDSAVQILHELNIQAEQVLDPTLLFDREYWSRFANNITRKKYVLVYQLHNDKKLGEYAKRVAKEKGLDLIRISTSFHQIIRSGKLIWCPPVSEFLGYIKNAELMITDSFHGTAFAIGFNTPFVEVLPNNKTGTRNLSILALTGLSDRILSDTNKDVEKRPIDFSYANKILSEKRIESMSVLKRMLEN